ncbi:AAA family ATPase [Vibrio sp. OCN044]|uniref:AAA family ATPase n=1 Tax=Vibrio tetraodonis subsp. pristinus TaxID=2695891 RepID=A0A6L8M2T3_9VIBR|nr:ParA family protein [Vibrio tetraodonis]MYM61600.1 AAA family ATPase [Vibrio tetraodonis subsp. pristinus]
MNARETGKQGKIIAIAHQKGGVGKTTIALNISAVLKPDILIDQDLHSGLVVLSNVRESGEESNIVTCETKDELIAQLRQRDDGKNIMVDCGGFDSDLNRVVIAVADLIIVPCNGNITERIGLRMFETVLSEVGQEVGKNIKGHVLYCRHNPNKTRFEKVDEFLSHSNHMTRLASLVPQRADYESASEFGLGVVEYKRTKGSKAAREVMKLCEEIKSIL